jgi:hypothetical protein
MIIWICPLDVYLINYQMISHIHKGMPNWRAKQGFLPQIKTLVLLFGRLYLFEEEAGLGLTSTEALLIRTAQRGGDCGSVLLDGPPSPWRATNGSHQIKHVIQQQNWEYVQISLFFLFSWVNRSEYSCLETENRPVLGWNGLYPPLLRNSHVSE